MLSRIPRETPWSKATLETRTLTAAFILKHDLVAFLATALENLSSRDISVRTVNCLANAGIDTVYQILELTDASLMDQGLHGAGRWIGRKSAKELRAFAEARGLGINTRLTREAKRLIGAPLADDDPREVLTGKEIADGPLKHAEAAMHMLSADHPRRNEAFEKLYELRRLLTS